jgi:hypothetical protein
MSRAPFVRRPVSGYEQDAIEMEPSGRRARDSQMGVVYRVERASEDRKSQ